MPQRFRRYSLLFFVLGGISLFAQIVPGRYTVILDDPPVSGRYAGRARMLGSPAAAYRQQIEARQQALIAGLRSRNFEVTGSASLLLNAVFVNAAPGRLRELAAIPGVKAVRPMRRFKPSLNAATQVINAAGAWTSLGGAFNAGKGIKIGIIDSGIDPTHPAFANTDLGMPPGYPLCTAGHPEDCAYTNNKVIVARSYVRQLAVAAVTDPANPAAQSQPDDYSPRDRMGHGTAVASTAAGESNTGTVTFTGAAPKAWLGNYKIAGSPGVNDGPTDDVLIQAVEDALSDGMDVVNISWGSLAAGDWISDPVAVAFENAVKAGMIVTAAAGNEGDSGASYPFYNSISSPSTAPSVISVGASTNSHSFAPSVSVASEGAPAGLKNLAALPGSSTFYPSRIGANAAPLVDVTLPPIGNDGLACTPLPAGSLSGAFALIQRGACLFADKAANAQAAGAVGVVFYMADSSPLISPATDNAVGPVVMISLADGEALRSYLLSQPRPQVVIDVGGIERSSTPNYLGYFSSRGPTPDGLLKPEVLSVGANVYLATQDYDPEGSMYSANRYAVAGGTSFAAPIAAGAAALVQQAHPAWSPAQVRSALINTAADSVKVENQDGAQVDIRSTGSGLLDAGKAVSAALLAEPAAISFGNMLPGPMAGKSQIVIVTNNGSGAVTVNAAAAVASQASGVTVAVTPSSAALQPGASAPFTVALSGDSALAGPGAHSGTVTFTSGANVLLRVPYLYVLAGSQAYQIVPFISTVQGPPGADAGILAVRATDANGAPVSNVNITFAASFMIQGAFELKSVEGAPPCTQVGALTTVECPTDSYGMAYVSVTLGSIPGSYNVSILSGRASYTGRVYVVPRPVIAGIADSAAYQTAVAPGSYVSLFGSDLIDTTQYAGDSAGAARAPLALEGINVSFDARVNGTDVSYPGRLVYAGARQVNVLVPWELRGAASAQVKVIVNESSGPAIYGNLFTVSLRDYAPALFENTGVAAALDANYAIIGPSNKATRGKVVMLYANGLGPVTNQPASGDPASASPLSWTTTMPVVTIGGQNAAVHFSGLAPGFPGLYQINVEVPSGIAAGNQPVTVSIGGQVSKASTLPVQ